VCPRSLPPSQRSTRLCAVPLRGVLLGRVSLCSTRQPKTGAKTARLGKKNPSAGIEPRPVGASSSLPSREFSCLKTEGRLVYLGIRTLCFKIEEKRNRGNRNTATSMIGRSKRYGSGNYILKNNRNYKKEDKRGRSYCANFP